MSNPEEARGATPILSGFGLSPFAGVQKQAEKVVRVASTRLPPPSAIGSTPPMRHLFLAPPKDKVEESRGIRRRLSDLPRNALKGDKKVKWKVDQAAVPQAQREMELRRKAAMRAMGLLQEYQVSSE